VASPYIIDSTLREGEQAPGVLFSSSVKQAIIAGLVQVGVEEIELGVASSLHPWLSTLVEAARHLSQGTCCLALWSRCRAEDIAFAAACGPDLLSLSMPVSDRHIHDRLRKGRTWVRETLAHSVDLALSLGIPRVSVGFEDATKADLNFLLELAQLAEQHGASRIRLADTVGIASPAKIQALVKAVKAVVSLELGVHCHNDFGMATANSIAALEAGADCLDAAVLGLGERAGCCRLEEVIGYLSLVQDHKKYQPEILPQLCQVVAQAAQRPIATNHPLIGTEIFTCESGLHQHGLSVNPHIYEPYPPERMGQTRTLRFGKKTGLRAVRLQLSKQGLQLDEQQARLLTHRIRSSGQVFSEQQLLCFAQKKNH
jgi:homocitrate synthase NifV